MHGRVGSILVAIIFIWQLESACISEFTLRNIQLNAHIHSACCAISNPKDGKMWKGNKSLYELCFFCFFFTFLNQHFERTVSTTGWDKFTFWISHYTYFVHMTIMRVLIMRVLILDVLFMFDSVVYYRCCFCCFQAQLVITRGTELTHWCTSCVTHRHL
jgi:hypothetical protein